jgi:hypothetical protein
VRISPVVDFDLAYFMVHSEVVAESPLPHLLPTDMKYQYRIMGITEQGNCVGGCPRSEIFVAIWNYRDYGDGNIKLYRIDGVRFWKFMGVREFKPDETNGFFLSFILRSQLFPREKDDYLVKIGFSKSELVRLDQNR